MVATPKNGSTDLDRCRGNRIQVRYNCFRDRHVRIFLALRCLDLAQQALQRALLQPGHVRLSADVSGKASADLAKAGALQNWRAACCMENIAGEGSPFTVVRLEQGQRCNSTVFWYFSESLGILTSQGQIRPGCCLRSCLVFLFLSCFSGWCFHNLLSTHNLWSGVQAARLE